MLRVGWGAARWVALGVGLMLLATLAQAPTVSASGQDVIYVRSPTSWSGPVDTQVSLSVGEYGGSPYTLSYTTTSPDSGGCASAQPMPGVGTFQPASVPGGMLTFRWPASLGHGQYYFCADPVAGGSGGHAASHQPYTALNDAAPSVQFSVPGPIQAGDSIMFALTNWVTSDGQMQPAVGLLAPGASYSSFLALGSLQPNGPGDPSTGSYVYTVQISPLIPAGAYALVVESECGMGEGTGNVACPVTEQSAPFTVTAAPTPTLGPMVTPLPTVTPNPHATPSILSGGSAGNLNQPTDNTLWYVGGAGVGLAGIASGAMFFVMRRRRKGSINRT